MKYLVTGGTGFLGMYIVEALQQYGNEVLIATRQPNLGNHILADFEKGILDMKSNSDLLSDSEDFIVIHTAGKAHSVPRSASEKKSFYNVNVGGTKLLLEKLETLSKLPKSLVFISSVSVYGLDSGQNIDENDHLNATDPYGKSKIIAEKIVLDWGEKHNVVISIIRLPLVVGKNPPGNLKSMINGIKSGNYFRIGNGASRKSMVWAADVASILPVVAKKGGIYNLADGYDPSFSELEDEITSSLHLKPVKKIPLFLANIAGIFGSIIEYLSGKKMPINKRMVGKITSSLTFSDQKARKEIGWEPSKVLEHINEMLS